MGWFCTFESVFPPWILRQPGFTFLGSRCLKAAALLPHLFPLTPPTREGPADDGRDVKNSVLGSCLSLRASSIVALRFHILLCERRQSQSPSYILLLLIRQMTHRGVHFKAEGNENWIEGLFQAKKDPPTFALIALCALFSQPWRPRQPWGPACS